jgi:hypothetical protein
MQNLIEKDGSLLVTLFIKTDEEELCEYYWADLVTGPNTIKKVHCTSEIYNQKVPLNEDFECIIRETEKLGWAVEDFLIDGLLSTYESLEGSCNSMSYSKEPVCRATVFCAKTGREIQAVIGSAVLKDVGLLGIPEGYPVLVDVQRENKKFVATKLIYPTARDVFDDTDEPVRRVSAFSHWYWSDNTKSNHYSSVTFGVSNSEDKPVLCVDITGRYLKNSGIKKIIRRPSTLDNSAIEPLIKQWEQQLRDKYAGNEEELEIFYLDIEIEWFKDANKWAYHRLIRPRKSRVPNTKFEIANWVEGTISFVKPKEQSDDNQKFEIGFKYEHDDIGVGESSKTISLSTIGFIKPEIGMKAVARMQGNESGGLVYWNLKQFHCLTLPYNFINEAFDSEEKELVN